MYCLLLWVRRPCWIQLAHLGAYHLGRGWYVYTGSAKRNLRPRLERHLSLRKRFHWHIDYLRDMASLRRIWVWPWTRSGECQTNARVRRLPKASFPIKGFGSSDCGCIAHLVSFPGGTGPPDPRAPFTYHVQGGRIRRVEVEP